MADSYRDIARALLDRANLRFQAKGTPYDVLYTEQETLDRSAAVSKYPGLDKPLVPARCIPGAKHPRCGYLVLVDAYRTGGDDHHDNWTLLYRVDLQQLAVDGGNADFAFPDCLADDGATTQFPCFDDSEDITWQFDVILPNGETISDPAGNPVTDPNANPLVAPNLGYTKPAQGTPHPQTPAALFLNEQWQRNGPVLNVTRHYKKVAPATAQQKIGYAVEGEYDGYYLVHWIYESSKADYNPPGAGSSCPIHDSANPTALNFSSYKIIAPPKVEILDPLNLRVTVTYGALPGPLIPMENFATGPEAKGTDYLQRRAMGDTFASQALKLDAAEVNGCSKVWKFTVPQAVTLSSQNYDSSTGLLDLISQVIVAAGTNGQALDGSGVMAEVKPLNEFYSLKETTTLALFNQRPVFVDYELDPETHDLITVTRSIVSASSAPDADLDATRGSEITQHQLNAVFSLRTTRMLKNGATPDFYDVPEHVDFTVPAKWISYAVATGDSGDIWRVNPKIDASYRRQIKARRHVSFHEEPPDNGTIWKIKPTTVNYRGIHFSLQLESVLTDGYDAFGPVGGSYTEQIVIPPSTPTLSEYAGIVSSGVPQLWAEECAQWRYGWWKLTQIYIFPE